MRPKKHFIDCAQANGSIDRLNQLLSASHILLCEANGLLEEAADLMKRNGLLLGELKQLHNQFTNSADRYFREFASMVASALNLRAPSQSYFSDVPEDAWYADGVNAMAAKGFFAGDGSTFRPEDTITYEEMVTVLSSVAAWASLDGYELAQKNLSAGEWGNYYQFSEWAQTSARNLDALGALVGDQQPGDAGTRETAAGLLCALMEATHLIWS